MAPRNIIELRFTAIWGNLRDHRWAARLAGINRPTIGDDLINRIDRAGKARPALARILRELFSNLGDNFVGGGPVRIACVAVEHQRTRLQLCVEFIPTERYRLTVIIRTNNFEIHSIAHEPPAARAIRPCFRSISLNGSASYVFAPLLEAHMPARGFVAITER